MEHVSDLPIALQSIGVFIVFLSLLLLSFSTMLNAKIEPLKDNQARLEKTLTNLESELKAEQKEIKKILNDIIKAISYLNDNINNRS